MELFLTFINLVFVGFVALFPPVNPIGTALIIDPFLHHLDTPERKAAAFRIAFYCLIICSVTILVGSWLLKLFGLSLPVVQLGGGILICKMGWELLSSNDSAKDSQNSPNPSRNPGAVDSILFYPLAFPMTTGAGTISVLLTLSAHAHSEDWTAYFSNLSALFVAVVIMSVVIYFSYGYTPALLRKLGPSGGQILNRLSAFLVFCVGIQIAVDGILHLIHPS